MQAVRKLIGLTGTPAVILLTLIPLYFWLPLALWNGPSAIFRSIGQAAAILGSVLLSLNFVLATRWIVIENMFVGLNRAYIVHHLIGAISFILLIFHPVFLILSYAVISPQAAAAFIIPTTANIPLLLGSIALALLIILLIITFYINMEYDMWKKTHILLGLPLFIAAFHAFLISTIFDGSVPLKVYMFAAFALGAYSFLYRIFRKYVKQPAFDYTISGIEIRQGVTLISLAPVKRHIRFAPGQFVYIQFFHRGVSPESHPFSIVTAPENNQLMFAVKSLGEYTETLKLLETGTKARVEGPYGRFSYRYMNTTRFVWIAGGIGVTPFLSMLQSLPPQNNVSVDFFYCVRDEKEALFLQDVAAKASATPNVRFRLWQSAVDGRFTGIILNHLISDIRQATILICGPPPMMNALKSQLTASGVKKRRIITEEFSLT